jgi:hypothetical protein
MVSGAVRSGDREASSSADRVRTHQRPGGQRCSRCAPIGRLTMIEISLLDATGQADLVRTGEVRGYSLSNQLRRVLLSALLETQPSSGGRLPCIRPLLHDGCLRRG